MQKLDWEPSGLVKIFTCGGMSGVPLFEKDDPSSRRSDIARGNDFYS